MTDKPAPIVNATSADMAACMTKDRARHVVSNTEWIFGPYGSRRVFFNKYQRGAGDLSMALETLGIPFTKKDDKYPIMIDVGEEQVKANPEL